MKTCACHDLEINSLKRGDRYDPTHTTSLRNAFVRDLNRRFRRLKASITRAIVDKDCFGLQNNGPVIMADPFPRQFDFPRSADKVDEFMLWLSIQIKKEFLETVVIPQLGQAIESNWTNLYIADSYKRGIIRARVSARKAHYKIPSLSETGGIEASMSLPFHVDRVGLLYTRVFSGLKGITDAMSNQIAQVLAQGMADGDSPAQIARMLRNTVSNGLGASELGKSLGRTVSAEQRARTLARTEIIRAHHQAMVQEYRNWEVENVMVQAEWVTAGYNVCPRCLAHEGKIFTLDAIQNMIPLHPNCRCCMIPVDVTEEVK